MFIILFLGLDINGIKVKNYFLS